jgi:hypothetical protein
MNDAAERYAKADPSDPFAKARARTHIKNGIATYARQDGGIGYYDAEEAKETRYLPLPNGEADMTKPYEATVYRNIMRP